MTKVGSSFHLGGFRLPPQRREGGINSPPNEIVKGRDISSRPFNYVQFYMASDFSRGSKIVIIRDRKYDVLSKCGEHFIVGRSNGFPKIS